MLEKAWDAFSSVVRRLMSSDPEEAILTSAPHWNARPFDVAGFWEEFCSGRSKCVKGVGGCRAEGFSRRKLVKVESFSEEKRSESKHELQYVVHDASHATYFVNLFGD